MNQENNENDAASAATKAMGVLLQSSDNQLNCFQILPCHLDLVRSDRWMCLLIVELVRNAFTLWPGRIPHSGRLHATSDRSPLAKMLNQFGDGLVHRPHGNAQTLHPCGIACNSQAS